MYITKAKSFRVSLRKSYNSKMEFRRSDIFMGGLSEIPEFENKFTSAKKAQKLISNLE